MINGIASNIKVNLTLNHYNRLLNLDMLFKLTKD